MKYRETCSCGAEIDIEDSDSHAVAATVRAWRDCHRCLGPRAWERSERSTNDVRLDFGFAYRDDEVTVND